MKRIFTLSIYRCLAIILLSLVTAGQALYATGDPSVKLNMLDGDLNQIHKDSVVTVSDSSLLNTDAFYSVNKLSFKIDESSPYILQGPFTASVRLHIEANLRSSVVSYDTTLTINYKGDSTYVQEHAFYLKNAFRVKATVLSVQTDAGWNVWRSLKVYNEIQSTGTYTFNCSTVVIDTIEHESITSSTGNDQLVVTWPNRLSADEYDLEWAYIDSSALADGLYGAPSNLNRNLLFENNATRVSVKSTMYKIPLIYDSKGSLFFRVRAAQVAADGSRQEGNWSTQLKGLGRFDYDGHERKLNWQATTTFAEEGKRKTVVQYYDGSLRSRQTVTKDNSTDSTIIAESFYDQQGRPVIQVLPSPSLDNIIRYTRDFNTAIGGSEYTTANYDTVKDVSAYCGISADSMSATSGASQYYSPANPRKDNGMHRFIPDARHFPFTEVQYTQDNTGRVSKQSGVGPVHQLGSGHETTYYYGTPSSEELDALFGTEVGVNSHYYKTMVRDANGQFSISYVDMHGRTIATALSGKPQSKLDTLASYKEDLITETLSDSNSAVIKDMVMESKKGLLVSRAGDHTFSYQLDAQSLSLASACAEPVCYDCLYDLRITISGDCNNQAFGGQPFDTLVKNFSIGHIDSVCNTSQFSFTFTKFLEEGSYDITKQLSVSQYALDYYRDSIYAVKNACRPMESFIAEQRDILAAAMASEAGCSPDSAACRTSVGSWSDFRNMFLEKSGIQTDTAAYTGQALKAYKEALAECAALSEKTSEYDDIRRAMLMDVSAPSGQYANADSLQDVYSIFYSGRHTSPTTDTIAAYQKVDLYLDETGQKDSVYDEASGTYLLPSQLSPAAFAQKFKESWAEALLPSHPEFCKLDQARLLQPSYDWARRFEAVDTYAEAMLKGYLNPTDLAGSQYLKYKGWTGSHPDPDPLESVDNSMNDDLANYRDNSEGLSIWQLATGMTICPAGSAIGCYSSNDPFGTALCGGDLDMAWRNFRQLYSDIRKNILNDYISSHASCPGAPTAAALIAASHQPQFGDPTALLSANGVNPPSEIADTAAYRQNLRNQAQAFYDTTCRAYATQWLASLKNCSYSSNSVAMDTIINRLVQVCKNGSDEAHPLGSSSVGPNSGYTYHSFEEVIDEYNSSHGISASSDCSADNITAPKPYNQQTVYSSKPLWTGPDSCECGKITAIHEQYRLDSSGYSGFSDYMQKKFNAAMPDSILNTLLGQCSDASPDCHYLKTPIMLPGVFQCYSGAVCASCEQVDSTYRLFKAKYPAVVPSQSAGDSVQNTKNLLFENYMNNRIGFSKTAAEYLSFIQSCQISVPPVFDSTQVDCIELETLRLEYYRTFVQPQSGLVDLDMRTFAGGKTPDEGPKGVFDVNGDFIANTVDSTVQAVKESYVAVWNSSAANQAVGTLSLLANGKFRLTLQPGQKAPCEGIVGMRYFQFNFNQTLLITSTDELSRLDLGDGNIVKATQLGELSLSTFEDPRQEYPRAFMPDMIPVRSININYFFPDTTTRIITIYHTDVKGVVTLFPGSTNLRGYMPKQTLYFAPRVRDFIGLNYFGIRNWSDAKRSIENLKINVADGINISQKAYFPDVAECSNVRLFTWAFNTANQTAVDSTELAIQDVISDPATSFPKLNRFQITGISVVNANKLVSFKFPHLRNAALSYEFLRPTQVDTIFNELASVNVEYGGFFDQFSLGSGWPGTSASASAVNLLKARNWVFNPSKYVYPSYPPFVWDDFPFTSQFAEFFNEKSGTALTPKQISDLYENKCNQPLDLCRPPATIDSLSYIREDFKNYYYNYGKKYDSDGSDTMSFKVDNGGFINNLSRSHKDVFANGIAQYPDSLRIPPAPLGVDMDFWGRDSACVNGAFSVEFRVKSPVDPSESAHRFLLYIACDFASNDQYLISFNQKDPYYNYLDVHSNNPARAKLFLDIPEFIQDFSYWRVIKIQIVDTLLKFYLDGSLIKTFNVPKLGNDKIYGYSLESVADHRKAAMFDWVRIYDGNGRRFYNEEFDDPANFKMFDSYIECPKVPCDQAFTKHYNDYFKKSLTFSQISSIYQANNVELNICDTADLKLCGSSAAVESPLDIVNTINAINNCSDSTFFIYSSATELQHVYADSLKNKFDGEYRAKCLQAYKMENFTVSHATSEFHYTLYYYDQAGNLVKTVPPKGVHPNRDYDWLAQIRTKRAAGETQTPAHTMVTDYRYNTLNQVVAQKTPDGGQSQFWYDRLGRLALSQNARQKAVSATTANRLYSYTKYDYIGRITEVGQIRDNAGATVIDGLLTRDPVSLSGWLTARDQYRGQVTTTVYDLSYAGYSGIDNKMLVQQRNLRNRVSYTSFTDTLAGSTAFNQATLYSYDIHGNVDTLLQDYGYSATVPNLMNKNENRFKKLSYNYDLISGKVNEVIYQGGWSDQVLHRYNYDAENRLILTESSFDSLHWEKDARYEYYRHGPLARVVLGDQLVQGTDYAYTLQGWLKGVNSTGLLSANEMGEDGLSGGVNQNTARDVVGFNLNYYDTSDYAPINSGFNPFPGTMAHMPSGEYRPLFNGNISSMAINNRALNTVATVGGPIMLYNYRYDQLNRLTAMDAYNSFNTGSNTWTGTMTALGVFKERVAYDPNGNINKYLRNGHKASTLAMDSLTYNYPTNSNQLDWVKDGVTSNVYGLAAGDVADIDNQSSGNYKYDEIGNLIKDNAEGITGIKWSVYGKILEINRTGTSANPVERITYTYDAQGNRISKMVQKNTGNKNYTWYVRDAQGNVMATYQSTGSAPDLTNLPLTLTERHIYGSSRLGIYSRILNVDGGPKDVHDSASIKYYRGFRQYELSNHLGNVLATISDKKKAFDPGADGTIDYYDADVTTAQDYYPFGMLMPGRNGYQSKGSWVSEPPAAVPADNSLPADIGFGARANNEPPEYVATNSIELTPGFESGVSDVFSAYITADEGGGGSGDDGSSGSSSLNGAYRYGFNGKENDNEVKGIGNQQDYGARIYDPRLGRFLSLDPLQMEYPMLTPYQYAGNNPISGIDLDGKEFLWYMSEIAEEKLFGTTHLRNVREGFTDRGVKTIKDGVHAIKTLKDSKNSPPTYGNGFTILTAGIPPMQKTKNQQQMDAVEAAGKQIVADYSDLIRKASQGDDRAIGALGFEVLMFFQPEGKGASAGMKLIPRGFKNAEQFAKVGEELAMALEKSGISFEEIGVRGSSVTGVGYKTGKPFRWDGANPSDIDVFVILKKDIPVSGGAARPEFIHPDKMMEKYPALKEWSEKWSEELKRDITPAAVKPNIPSN